MAHEGTYSGQSPAFIATLGATRYSFSINVAHAHGGDSVGSRWMFFLSSFFSLSFPGKTHLNFQKKKQLYTLVCNLINFDPPFNYCFIWLLMLFEVWIYFNFILGYFFNLIFLSDLGPSTFNCSIYVLYIFLIYFFFNFFPFNFIAFFNSLKAYMIVNFKTYRISWNACKLTRTPTLIIIKKRAEPPKRKKKKKEKKRTSNPWKHKA